MLTRKYSGKIPLEGRVIELNSLSFFFLPKFYADNIMSVLDYIAISDEKSGIIFSFRRLSRDLLKNAREFVAYLSPFHHS